MITQSCHTSYTKKFRKHIILVNKFAASSVKDDTGQLKPKNFCHSLTTSMLTVLNNIIWTYGSNMQYTVIVM